MRAVAFLAVLPAFLASQALAQGHPPGHGAHHPPGEQQPQAAPRQTAPAEEHAGHGQPTERRAEPAPGQQAPRMEMRRPMAPSVGAAAAPTPPRDHAADRVFGPAAMHAARKQLRREQGGAVVSKVMANLLEHQIDGDADGYRWDGEAWIGGDINRAVLKTEGEGEEGGLEHAEAQLLYSRAIAPFFDAQAGLRYDFESSNRTYATLGVEGIAPYWFDVEGALFLSDRGEILARLEGAYDLRLTQRLIIQPRLEVNVSADDIPETETGAGISDFELGLRIRYEIRREFAPYIGVTFDQKSGETADFARAAGEDTSEGRVVAGLRAWF